MQWATNNKAWQYGSKFKNKSDWLMPCLSYFAYSKVETDAIIFWLLKLYWMRKNEFPSEYVTVLTQFVLNVSQF